MLGLAGFALVAVLAVAQAGPAATPPPGDDLVRRAEAARADGRLDQASALYREALGRHPRWAEGWGVLGGLAYEQDRFAECRDAFRRLVGLQPGLAPAWALRGLCEFRLGEHAAARIHLDRALAGGPLPDEALTRVVLYHRALLLIRAREFELAIGPLSDLLRSQAETPELIDACGLLLLRQARLPSEVPPAGRTLVDLAGRAYCSHLARRSEEARSRFEEAIVRFPAERHLHYGLGLALAQEGSSGAIEAFRRETELFPDHELAHLELAFSLLARGAFSDALAPARAAVRLGPRLFATHVALGRALAGSGDATRGIAELEEAARLAPDVPEIYSYLSRAYAQAGRKVDSEKAAAVFRTLEEARRRKSAARPSGPP